MEVLFYISAGIAVLATLAAITRMNPVHALLYFILSLLAVSVIFFVLGAHFVAAIIIIINAGAMMVLLVFVIMMVNQGKHTVEQEKERSAPKAWIAPLLLAGVLLTEMIFIFLHNNREAAGAHMVTPVQVGITLFGPYVLAVELISMILMVGLLGAYHLARESHFAKKSSEKQS